MNSGSAAGPLLDDSMPNDLPDAGLPWHRVVELVILGVFTAGLLGALLWHFRTFTSWVDDALLMAEQLAASPVNSATGMVTAAVNKSQDGVIRVGNRLGLPDAMMSRARMRTVRPLLT